MVLKRIWDALARLEAGQEALLAELQRVKRRVDLLDTPEEPAPEEKLQQGIDNLMAFDGMPRKRGI